MSCAHLGVYLVHHTTSPCMHALQIHVMYKLRQHTMPARHIQDGRIEKHTLAHLASTHRHKCTSQRSVLKMHATRSVRCKLIVPQLCQANRSKSKKVPRIVQSRFSMAQHTCSGIHGDLRIAPFPHHAVPMH